ncbi:MAG: hypothetical protein JNM56_04170 [Planctomycetia bacterium]|nr:hypothetical protein [Planctomycetia bacterium]
MNPTGVYSDLRGRTYHLCELDDAERTLLQEFVQYANDHPDWGEYGNFRMAKIGEFYAARGLDRRQTIATPLWRISQDIGSRLLVAAGHARAPDYRSDLDHLIRENFRTRREFCDATGISEDMLSHVLAGRKHLAIDTLSQALERIGYRLQITPRP